MESLKGFGCYLKSYAKINVFLRVLGKRIDGFHEIFSYIHPINLYDEVYFEERKDFKIIVETFNAKIKMEENLAYKAALKMLEFAKVKKGINIKIYKNIPLGSGLGGGSSNCAVVLKFLNKYWRCNLRNKELLKISSLLGSDVPFFINSKPAIVSGRGEKILKRKIPIKLPKKIFLFIPNFSIPTKEVYLAWDLLWENKILKFKKEEYLRNLKFENLKRKNI